ncbi:T9SS type A sorting domain-containing protein [candidate division WOR-3 bacterium]|nr:T9SS type A sorting domain-containing protein [candidate division WOR-3 bacterium]
MKKLYFLILSIFLTFCSSYGKVVFIPAYETQELADSVEMGQSNLHFISYVISNPSIWRSDTCFGSQDSIWHYYPSKVIAGQAEYDSIPWSADDSILSIISWEKHTGELEHTGYYAVSNGVLPGGTGPYYSPNCSLRAIPSPDTLFSSLDSIVLIWNKPIEDPGDPDTTNIIGYTIYQSADGINFGPKLNANIITDTTFTDTLSRGGYYAIAPVFQGGHNSWYLSSNSPKSQFWQDVGTYSIDNPVDTIEPVSITPQATFKNYGLVTIKNFQVFCEIGSEETLVYADTIPIDSLVVGDTISKSFNPWTPCATCSLYTMNVYTVFPRDWNFTNDTLSKPIVVYIHNVGITEIVNPNTVVEPYTPALPTIKIHNFGNATETFWAFCEIDTPPGILVYSDSTKVEDLNVKTTRDVPFNNSWQGVEYEGIYNMETWVVLPNDIDMLNDTLKRDIEVHISRDARPIRILNPPYYIPTDCSTEVNVVIENASNLPLYDFYTKVEITNSKAVYSESILIDSIGWPSYDSTLYFPKWLPATEDNFTITVITQHPRDTVPANDTLKRVIYTRPGLMFADDFEAGSGNWQGDWKMTDESAHTGDSSFTDLPGASYPNDTTLICELIPNIDLSGWLSAKLEFYTKYELEDGYDFGYVDISLNKGKSWTNIKKYTGTQTDWGKEILDLSQFCGNSIKLRFKLTSDKVNNDDGWFLDDVLILVSSEDETAPFISHTPLPDTVGVSDSCMVIAEITDPSGVKLDSLLWQSEGVSGAISHDSVAGNSYYYTLPEQPKGRVEYWFWANDNCSPSNAGESPHYTYTSGDIAYADDGRYEVIYPFPEGNQIAVLFSGDTLWGAYIYFLPGDWDCKDVSVKFCVWKNADLVPGDIDTSFNISVESGWNWISLNNGIPASNGIFVGAESISDSLAYVVDIDLPISGYSQYFDGAWNPVGDEDFLIRGVFGEGMVGPPGVEEKELSPFVFKLYSSRPNPAKKNVIISYELPKEAKISFKVYNVTGRLVKVLKTGIQKPGFYTIKWNGKDKEGKLLPSGIYFYRLKAGKFISTKKLILLR